jgi:uncharacterized protein (TIGR02466 family)
MELSDKFSAGNNKALETDLESGGKVLNIWPTAVTKSNIGRKFTYPEQSIVDKDAHRTAGLSENLRTVSTDVLSMPILKDIKSFILERLEEYVETVIQPVHPLELYITQSWMSFTTTSQAHHPHWHSNSILSGVLYLKADEVLDSICLYNNASSFNNRSNFHIENTPTWWTSRKITIPVKTGDLLIFPSYQDHGVDKVNKPNHYRVSLAFNTWFRGQLGTEDALNRLTLE